MEEVAEPQINTARKEKNIHCSLRDNQNMLAYANTFLANFAATDRFAITTETRGLTIATEWKQWQRWNNHFSVMYERHSQYMHLHQRLMQKNGTWIFIFQQEFMTGSWSPAVTPTHTTHSPPTQTMDPPGKLTCPFVRRSPGREERARVQTEDR